MTYQTNLRSIVEDSVFLIQYEAILNQRYLSRLHMVVQNLIGGCKTFFFEKRADKASGDITKATNPSPSHN